MKLSKYFLKSSQMSHLLSGTVRLAVLESMTGGGLVVMVSFLLFFDRWWQQLARMSCQILGVRADGF
jgi:hypothetical protein